MRSQSSFDRSLRATSRSAYPSTSSRRAARCVAAVISFGGVGVVGTVRLKRGAGAGCTMPSTSTKVPRAFRCGCSGASDQSQHGRHAGVGVLRSSAAHSSRGLGLESARRALAFAAGQLAGSFCGPSCAGSMLEHLQQLRVELAFDRADREPSAVGALVDIVEMRAGIGHVACRVAGSTCRPRACRRTSSRARRCHRRWPHRRPGPCPSVRASMMAAQNAERQIQRAAAIVADQIQRHGGRLILAADRVQHAGDRDVAEVVAGRHAPAGRSVPSRSCAHRPGADCARGTRRVRVPVARSRRGESLRSAHRPARSAPALSPPRCGSFRSSPIVVRLRSSRLYLSGRLMPSSAGCVPIDAQHGRAEIGEQHRAHRARPDAGKLDDLDAGRGGPMSVLSACRIASHCSSFQSCIARVIGPPTPCIQRPPSITIRSPVM